MNDDIHALIGASAVDALSESERARFEQHLSVCPHCQLELLGLQAAAGELSATTVARPPTVLRAGILTQTGCVRPLPPVVPQNDSANTPDTPIPLEQNRGRHSGQVVRRCVAAAVAAATLLVGGLTWHPWSPTSPTQVSAAQQVLHASDARRYVQRSGRTTATVVRSKHLHRAVLVATHMAPPPAGHTYQLWYYMPTGKAVSAGLAPAPSDTGKVTAALTGNADAATGAAVTVEPTGGSSQPTNPILTFPFTG